MNNIKILIVEDELLIAENVAIKLKKLGYSITEIVSSGKAALKSVKNQAPDLVLMDISIKGGMDGITTASAIRKIQEVAIIFLTAYADDETLERAAAVGCYGYLIKPFKDRELQAAIKVALNKHQEQTNIQTSLQTKISEYSLIQRSLQESLSEYREKNNNIHVDSLTQLPNKLFLQDLFEYLLLEQDNLSEEEDSDKRESFLSMLCIHIDRFQRITDSLGRINSDLLIKAIAEKLTNLTTNLPKEIVPGVIRSQESEFVILLSKIKDRKVATNFAHYIINELQKPFQIDDREIFVTASIGVSLYNSRNKDAETLLEQAVIAMEYAQEQGGNKYKLHTPALDMMLGNSIEDISLETELHYALKRQELELYYQPNIDLKTGKIAGAEALIRWHHPKIGLVAPSRFIPIAEASGSIESIGEWVLKTACKQTKHWHQIGFSHLNIAINLSHRQFKQLNLFHRLTQILLDSKLDPKFLELDLTEKVLVENIKVNIQRLNLIKKLGVSISLDDFGTGYCSLGYLQQFPFDNLKIDRCFTRNVDRNRKNSVIVQSIIEMAHALELKVVAEGIETESELEFLQKVKCDEVQGYLFSRPLPAREFEKLLKAKTTLMPIKK